MTADSSKKRAPRNRTLELSAEEFEFYRSRLLNSAELAGASFEKLANRTICGDLFEVLPLLPSGCCELVFADPPYNIGKTFKSTKFKELSVHEYADWLRRWLPEMKRLLRPSGSIYVCGDWRSGGAIQSVLEESFIIHNRITWEREKGRGAKRNWKNNSEDIWFASVSNEYVFNLEAVMLKRKVIAPYRTESGAAKDWTESEAGRHRLSCPSNLWTDLTVPFWSMPENTDHPTQKPEKLLAKIILAASNPGDVVFDPFLGSGTTSVAAKKLGRRYFGVELEEEYCCLAEKRLELAATTPEIQGYEAGVFRERNSR